MISQKIHKNNSRNPLLNKCHYTQMYFNYLHPTVKTSLTRNKINEILRICNTYPGIYHWAFIMIWNELFADAAKLFVSNRKIFYLHNNWIISTHCTMHTKNLFMINSNPVKISIFNPFFLYFISIVCVCFFVIVWICTNVRVGSKEMFVCSTKKKGKVRIK